MDLHIYLYSQKTKGNKKRDSMFNLDINIKWMKSYKYLFREVTFNNLKT